MIKKKDYEYLLENPIKAKCSLRGCDNEAKYILKLSTYMENINFEAQIIDPNLDKTKNVQYFLCYDHYKLFRLCDYCHNLLDSTTGNSAYNLKKDKTLTVCDKCNELEVLKRWEHFKEI